MAWLHHEKYVKVFPAISRHLFFNPIRTSHPSTHTPCSLNLAALSSFTLPFLPQGWHFFCRHLPLSSSWVKPTDFFLCYYIWQLPAAEETLESHKVLELTCSPALCLILASSQALFLSLILGCLPLNMTLKDFFF